MTDLGAVRARVLDLLDEGAHAATDALTELVQVPSVGGTDAENEAIHHMSRWMNAIGLEVDHWQVPLVEVLARPDFPGVEVDRTEAWGAVGRLPGAGGAGDGRSLMLNGHVDVVPSGDPAKWTGDAFRAVIRGGDLIGRGSCDMKAGVVASMWAVDAIRRAGVVLNADLLVATVLGEEDGGLGTYATLQRGWRADACVIPEPTNLDLVPANAGALTFRLIVHGVATHASRRTEGVSAIERFVPVMHALTELERMRNEGAIPVGSPFPLISPISIGTITAGDWASSVPDRLVAEGRCGVLPGEPMPHTRAALEAAVAQVCATDPWLRDHPVDVQWWGGQFASGRLPDHSDLLQRVGNAHASVSGAAQSTWTAPYGSDLRLLTGIGGIPTLQYGPGDSAAAHGPDESVPLAEMHTTARALAVLALDMCGVHSVR
ncbi:MAG: putative amidohydrolase/peptidase/deacetylase [Ilumatobacteraceae bacterium]|nr:putative amidohydrolase/peptidase/deacetylase [Ilumatobacteraceae bacterium]